jgi:uncharacterized protein (DUF302 family)
VGGRPVRRRANRASASFVGRRHRRTETVQQLAHLFVSVAMHSNKVLGANPATIDFSAPRKLRRLDQNAAIANGFARLSARIDIPRFSFQSGRPQEGLMTYKKHSSRSLDQLDSRLREAATRHKFGVLHVHDLEQTLKSKGIELGSACRVYDVCNPQAAFKALGMEMAVSTVLPCRITIFTDRQGCTIATVKPTDLLQATGLNGVEALAEEVEREVLAIIDEAA